MPVGYVFILIDAMRNDPSDSQSNANKVKMMKILRHVPKALRFSGLQCVVDDFFPAQVGAPGEEHCEDCAAEEAEDAA